MIDLIYITNALVLVSVFFVVYPLMIVLNIELRCLTTIILVWTALSVIAGASILLLRAWGYL